MPKHKHKKLDTLLSEESIEAHIKFARQTLIEKGHLWVQVVIQTYNGALVPIIIEDWPGEPDDKEEAMRKLGQLARAEFGGIKEAILMAETWVTNLKSPGADKIPPSQHPDRQEAIVIAGRNEDNSNNVLIIQRFSRNEADEPIWHQPEVHRSQDETGITFEGILDYLFEVVPDLRSPQLKA